VDVLLAAGHRLRGDYELALRTVPDASAGGPWCGPVLAELARIYLAMGDVPSAVEQATKAVRLSRACGYRVDEERARQVLVSAMKQE
jgi:Flp pilus assembly protein TadD